MATSDEAELGAAQCKGDPTTPETAGNVVVDQLTDNNCNPIDENHASPHAMQGRVDEVLQKERWRPRNNNTTAASSSTHENNNGDNGDDNNIEIGAVHINERAPNINRRFFQGIGGRLRAREERAAQREANNDGSSENVNNAVENDGEIRPGMDHRTASTRNFLSRLGITNNNNNNDDQQLRGSNFSTDQQQLSGNNNPEGLISATLVEDEEIVLAQVIDEDVKPPESEVERIVQRLELRNANRVSVPMEVKNKFERLCNDAACKRTLGLSSLRGDVEEGGIHNDKDEIDNNSWHSSRSSDSSDSSLPTSMESKHGINPQDTISEEEEETERTTSPYILRSDIIQIRNTIRLTVESRTKYTRIKDSLLSKLGFRCHSKVLLHVLNRAVDLIDESLVAQNKQKERRRRSSMLTSTDTLDNMEQRRNVRDRRDSFASFISNNSDEQTKDQNQDAEDDIIGEEFYYKDFSFYNLKVESNYPWMRNATVFSLLCILAFYIFTPILWCLILKDENICPSRDSRYGGEEESYWHVLLTPLYFASVTMSTVGYGDVTVLVNRNIIEEGDYSSYAENWRIFIATLYMILSLMVTIVGFLAGLNSKFRPLRGHLSKFGNRVYEIVRDAKVRRKGVNDDKHEEMVSWMRWAKFSLLTELTFSFLILTLIGMFAVQLSLLGENANESGISLTWMESFYWAVQTTTSIGYGDVETPESLRWFILFYLAISTYFAGAAFGKLNELSTNLESMQRLFLWEQQQASYTMLADFSGRPDHRDVGGIGETDETLDVDPEINQFEFTIASLVLLGKITSDDVKPILEKFKKLTNGRNKITPADVGRSADLSKDDDEQDLGSNNNDEESQSHATEDEAPAPIPSSKSTGTGALAVGMQIARAFKEEILSSGAENNRTSDVLGNEDEESVPNYSRFRIPKNTHAIAIDDSKIQRKLLGKFFDFAGITSDQQTIVGDGYDEIMGFIDFVVNFCENHSDDFVFLIVDENLDVVNENSEPMTISGSMCVESIRKRLPIRLEKRLFALIRSANDSSSDINIYSSRAHGFLPKAPVKRDNVVEMLAPLWLARFPPSEFGETMGLASACNTRLIAEEDIACTPYDIAQKVTYIESLFESDVHISATHMIHDQMHELKGDLLTLNCSEQSVSVMSIIGDINLILVARSPETIVDRWRSVRDHVYEIVNSLERNFRVPNNTYAIAIDDSKIQRKLLGKFFDFIGIPEEQCVIKGDDSSEILNFEDFVVEFMENHSDDFVFMVVDENLDVINESTQQHECISGSTCVESIRKRLPHELERRMLAVVRSANDSTRDIDIYKERAHGFLAKAPIRREKVKEVLAPLWLKRFPPSQFGDCFDDEDVSKTDSSLSEELACSTEDIAQKLSEINALFMDNIHVTDWRRIHDQLHMLKGDLLTMDSGASMISSLGLINIMLLGHSMGLRMDADAVLTKWRNLQEHVMSSMQARGRGEKSSTPRSLSRWVRRSATDSILRRSSTKSNGKSGLTSSFVSAVSTASNDTVGTMKRSGSKSSLTNLTSSFVSIEGSGRSSMKRSGSRGSLNNLTSSFVSTASNMSGISEDF